MPKSAYPIIVLVVALWLIFLVDLVIPAQLVHWGLKPRSIKGLVGIPLMPLLHAGFWHLLSNTVPLVILLYLTLMTRQRAWNIVICLVLLSGIFLWLVGRSANHVGASGLIFGLVAFLITVGVREKQPVSLGVAVLVGLLFGSSLFWGIVPSFGSSVSWDGHLCGAVAGVLTGVVTTQKKTAFF